MPRPIPFPIPMQSNFIEMTLRDGFSPVYLLHVFETPFPKNNPGRLFSYLVAVKVSVKALRNNSVFSISANVSYNDVLSVFDV